MEVLKASTKILENGSGCLEIDLFGGAITSFKLHEGEINPLSFRFSAEQMPANNKAGAPYRGHFLCLGRWGLPSEGEIKAGVPDHGQIANIMWQAEEGDQTQFEMQTHSELEGLHVKRLIQMDINSPVYIVNEEVTNTNPLGRLYNMVQHPTLGRPFLDDTTIINCNAGLGFDHCFSNEPEKDVSSWPIGIGEDMKTINLSNTEQNYSSVFSFIVKKEAKFGWVSAYSPTHNLILGYVWERKDYSWINLWQDWHEDKIRYRGIEFGTTGIHKPFGQILEDGNWKVFGENTCEYIDAGEKLSRKYLSFLCKVQPGFQGIDELSISKGLISLKDDVSGQHIELAISLKNFYDL